MLQYENVQRFEMFVSRYRTWYKGSKTKQDLTAKFTDDWVSGGCADEPHSSYLYWIDVITVDIINAKEILNTYFWKMYI